LELILYEKRSLGLCEFRLSTKGEVLSMLAGDEMSQDVDDVTERWTMKVATAMLNIG
jgi:hypothetical protein